MQVIVTNFEQSTQKTSGKYTLKFNSKYNRKRCEISSDLKIKKPEHRQ